MPHEFLHAKIRIGSAKNSNVNFKRKTQAFHADDIPYYAKERVAEVREWNASQILKVNNFPWVKKSSLDRKVVERASMTNHIKDRAHPMIYNYRAEVNGPILVAPIDKPTKFHISTMVEKDAAKNVELMRSDRLQRGQFARNAEVPTSWKLVDAKPWDNSCKQSDELRNKFFVQKTEKAMRNTRKINTSLEELDYVSPIKRSKEVSKKVRDLKRSGQFSPKRALARPMEEKIDQTQFTNKFALEPSRKYTHSVHSGVWEYNQKEGKEMWSDTGSFTFESRGDVEKVHNPDGYNYVGPTLAPAPLIAKKEKRINLIEKQEKKIRRLGPDGMEIPEAF